MRSPTVFRFVRRLPALSGSVPPCYYIAMISAETLKRRAEELGFSACGLAPAAPISEERQAEYRAWLDEGAHADMDYLARNTDKRFDPRLLVEGARTVVSLAVNYYPGNWDEVMKKHGFTDDFSKTEAIFDKTERAFHKAQNTKNAPNTWKLARYAYGSDYHEVVKDMLRKLLVALGLREGTDGRCFVDTAPIDEKYWAEQCGLGWRGRNSQLIIPQAGSYYFLGELVLTHEADRYDRPATNRCGPHCGACLAACPTKALRGDGTLDARRCLSYLTIEHRGDIPAEAADKLAPCIYGCDRCAEVCPWNITYASPTPIEALQPRRALLAMTPEGWRKLTVEQYQLLFRKSAVKRAKFEGLTRNIRATDAHDAPQ